MKKALILLAEGFEEIEAITPIDFLRRAGIETTVASIAEDRLVSGSHRVVIQADVLLSSIEDPLSYDALIIPGGQPGADNLSHSEIVLQLIRDFDVAGKLISAICAGPKVLHKAGILEGRKVTSYPSSKAQLTGVNYADDEIITYDKNLITSRGPATAVQFSFGIINFLVGAKAASEVRDRTLLKMLETHYKEV